MTIADSKPRPSTHLRSPWNVILPLFTKIFVWGLLFSIVYILRSFFTLIFLTFVFAYVQATSVDRLGPYIKNRIVRVVLVAIVILGLLIALGTFLVPRVKTEAVVFVDRLPEYVTDLDEELHILTKRYPALAQALPELTIDKEEPSNTQPTLPVDLKHSVTAEIIQQLLGMGESSSGKQTLRYTFEAMRNIGTSAFAIGSAFLLSLLFSFLIVLDLPRLTESAKSLAKTKLRFIYLEAAGTIVNFCKVLGKALEAQLFIAFLNTALTAIGLAILGLTEKVAFLSVIVFLCSFIPVAGVFISSVPICLVALQESGLSLMLLAILLITIIHMVEAYILNPKIYGHHLRMNPVIVLIILTVAGKMFHVWGLVLGVPVCTYIFGHAIRKSPYDDDQLAASTDFNGTEKTVHE